MIVPYISKKAFASKEERFLLYLLKPDKTLLSEIVELVDQGLNWEYLSKSVFLSALYQKIKVLPSEISIPESFKHILSEAYSQNIALNEFRIKSIKELSTGLREKGVEIIYLKGAAEIVENYSCTSYLGSRYMADIDFVCKVEDLETVHTHLTETGNVINEHDLPAVKRFQILPMTGHFIYNRFSTKCIEAHVDRFMFQHQKHSYPPEFENSLFAHPRKIELGKAEILIPAKEHMLAYLICHSAGRKDYKFICNKPDTIYDRGLSKQASPREIINCRLCNHQLRYLFQIDLFLCEHADKLDYAEVLALLSGVRDKDLINLHLGLAALYTQHSVFEKPGAASSEDTFCRSRQIVLEKLVRSQAIVRWLKRFVNDGVLAKLKLAFYKMNSSFIRK